VLPVRYELHCNYWLQVTSISQLTVSRLSRQCGILNISQPSRPPWPVTGIALFFFTYTHTHAQQFVFRAYCGTAGPVSKMASKQEKAFCVLRFEVSRSMITVQ
jgi:hypothetical protein